MDFLKYNLGVCLSDQQIGWLSDRNVNIERRKMWNKKLLLRALRKEESQITREN